MDFLDPQKRKKHKRRILIGYGLLAILVELVSVLLLFQAYGYTYNVRTGNISQNGLLFVDSHPVSSVMFLNGESKGVTDHRLVLDEGSYDISLQQTGYHNWEKTVNLRGGTIERFLYPFLFPANVESSDTQLYASQPEFSTQSPDRVWSVVQQPGELKTFDVFNLTAELPLAEEIELPDDVFTSTGSSHELTLVEWSNDNRHFVVQHEFSGGVEYILVDRDEPAQSRNLSDLLTTPFASLRLRDKKFDQYYLLTKDRVLQRASLSSPAPTQVATNVLAYQSHGDDELLYVTDSGRKSTDTVDLRMVDNGQTYTIHSLVRSEKYLLEVAQYDGNWLLVAAPSKEGKTYVFEDPVAALQANSEAQILPDAVLRVKDASKVSFSQNTRIVAAQAGSKIGVYDAESERTIHYDSDVQPSAKGFGWMDGHRLTAISDGVQHVFDFDGTNKRTLGPGYDNTLPYFDRDYTAVFTLGPSMDVDGRAALIRTELVVDEETLL